MAKKNVTLNKPHRIGKGEPGYGKKKFAVYVKNDKGNVVRVTFGDPNMEIKRDNPNRRKNFRSRHSCDDNPGPKWKARYWSCRMWEKKKSVTDYTSSKIDPENYKSYTFTRKKAAKKMAERLGCETIQKFFNIDGKQKGLKKDASYFLPCGNRKQLHEKIRKFNKEQK
jgi:hypothetical protein